MSRPLEKASPDRMRLQESRELFCPPLTVSPRAEGGRQLIDVTDWQGLETIGLELRVAFEAISKTTDLSADNSFYLRKCRELCLRPAVEPLLLAHWEKLKGFGMAERQVANFCSLMCGSKQQARTSNSYGLMEGAEVQFEPAEQARSWWPDIQAVANDRELAPLLPAYCFARTIIAHPYPDGNGRLARALVHAALARTADYSAPVLPLAPAFYMNAAKVAAALRQLSDTSNWDAFNAVFWLVLEDAMKLAGRLGPSQIA